MITILRGGLIILKGLGDPSPRVTSFHRPLRIFPPAPPYLSTGPSVSFHRPLHIFPPTPPYLSTGPSVSVRLSSSSAVWVRPLRMAKHHTTIKAPTDDKHSYLISMTVPRPVANPPPPCANGCRRRISPVAFPCDCAGQTDCRKLAITVIRYRGAVM